MSDPQLWLNALPWFPTNADEEDKRSSVHVSQLVAECCRQQQEILEPEAFGKLTACNAMPFVHPDVALTLVELDDKLDKEVDKESAVLVFPNDYDDSVTLEISLCVPSQENLLQQRCVQALSAKWRIVLAQDEAPTKGLSERKPGFMISLLGESLKKSASAMESQVAHQTCKFEVCEADFKPAREEWQEREASLQNDLTRMCTELDHTKETVICLRHQLNTSNTQQNEVKELAEKLKKAESLERNLATAHVELRRSQAQAASLEQQVQTLKSNLGQSQEEIFMFRQQENGYFTKLIAPTREKEQLSAAKNAAQSQLATTQEQFTAQVLQIHALEGEKEQLAAAKNQSESQLTKAEAKLETL